MAGLGGFADTIVGATAAHFGVEKEFGCATRAGAGVYALQAPAIIDKTA